jgi:hypothetical protein
LEDLGDTHFRRDLIRLFKRFASPSSSLSEEDFNLQKNELLKKLRTEHPDAVDKGEMYADNLLELAKKAKSFIKEQIDQQVSEAEALNKLDGRMEFLVGKAKDAVRTEAQLNAVDKITNFIQKWTGGVLNEATVAVGVAAVYSVAGKAIQGSLKKAASFFVAGMAVTGAVGAMRESRKLEVERSQHAREMAQGKTFDEQKAERRKEMEHSRIEFKKASAIKAELELGLFSKLDYKEPKDLTREEFKQAMEVLADLEARVEISDTGIQRKGRFFGKNKYKVDLIGYSDVTKTAQEQGELDVMRAKAKIALKKWTEANGRNFEEDFRIYQANQLDILINGDKGVEAKNKIFAEMKSDKVRKAFIKSAVMSGVVGLAVQEARALFDEHMAGLIERGVEWVRGKNHIPVVGEKTTLAEGAFRRAKEFFEPTTVHAAGSLHETLPGVKINAGFELKPDGHGHYLVFDHGKVVSDPLNLNPDRTLTPDAKKWLIDHGYNVTETPGSRTLSGIHNLDKAATLKLYPNLAEHPRVDWHDEPGQFWSDVHKKFLEFEGTQQMGYLEKDGDKVYLNISKIADNFLENIQKQIDAAGNTMPGFGEVNGYSDTAGNQFVAEKLKHLKDKIQDSIEDGTFFKHF